MAQIVKIFLQCWRPRCGPWIRKIPQKRKQIPIPVFLPGEFHEQRSLEGYSPCGCKESDTTEPHTHTYAHTHIRTHTYAHTRTHMHTHITRRRKALLQQKTFHHMFAGVSSVSDCSGVCFSGFLILYILTIYWMADNLNDRLLVARFCHTYL